MAELAIHTGQPLADLLEMPPSVVRALRAAWNEHARQQNERQKHARSRAHRVR